jgi:ubiquinone/menaquinone biosynthesis C-methylase UbiE
LECDEQQNKNQGRQKPFMKDPLFDEWRAYEKLLSHDYMDHVLFFRRLEGEIQQEFDHPVSILDLGCGDTSPIQPMLRKLAITQYSGVDQSETALSKAEGNMATLDIPCRLYAGDLLDTLHTLDHHFDVVLASFSFHHIETAEIKKQVLEACRRVLMPNGLLAIIDVFCDENETREQYLDRWVDMARENYVALNQAEMTCLVDHVRANDFPGTLSGYQSISRLAGFGRFNVLARDQDKLNHLVALRP